MQKTATINILYKQNKSKKPSPSITHIPPLLVIFTFDFVQMKKTHTNHAHQTDEKKMIFDHIILN